MQKFIDYIWTDRNASKPQIVIESRFVYYSFLFRLRFTETFYFNLSSFYFFTKQVYLLFSNLYFTKMKSQSTQLPTKNIQYYLNHTFSLSDLQALISPYQSFRCLDQAMQINPDQNFTFQTLQYSFQLYDRPQNHIRILYYALLSSIYDSDKIPLKDKIQQTLQKIILQNFDVILPFKNTFKKGQKNISTIITTNQIKSSFVKFLQLLNSSNQKNKIVLTEIIRLPQIDFIFMSIFHMYFSKNLESLNHKLEKISKDFGVKTQLQQNGFQIQGFNFQIKKGNSQNWQIISVRKKQQSCKFKKQFKLKNKGTTQSIGEIEQDNLYTSEVQLNQGLNRQELINARFVQSCQSKNFFDLQNQTISQEVIQFVWNNQTPKIFMALKQNTNLQENSQLQTKKVAQKKTTFLNQNNNLPVSFSKFTKIQRKKQKMKSAAFYLSLNNYKIPQNLIQKQPGTQKSINAQNKTRMDKTQNSQNKTLSTDFSKGFLRFSKVKQNETLSIAPSLTKNFSQIQKLNKSVSSKFFLATVATT